MDVTELDALVRAVGHEFHKRKMADHLRPLRLYWLALNHGLLPSSRLLRVDWDARLTEEWAKLFKLPGHKPYPEKPRGSRCPCETTQGHPVDTHTAMTLPWGIKVHCRACGSQWIENDPRRPQDGGAAQAPASNAAPASAASRSGTSAAVQRTHAAPARTTRRR